MTSARRPLRDTLDSLPPEWTRDPLPSIREEIAGSGRKLVVLDDDPTGAQTVYGVPVLTEWSEEILTREMRNELSCFYVLTNSRGMPLSQAKELNIQIGGNLVRAARNADKQFTLVGRSDSTLRGHFPGEVDALVNALGRQFDAWIIIPFFLEGGRFTIDDTHYVAEADWLVPAGDTEFARDAAFSFQSSDLRDWVEEKTGGRVPASEVASISLDDLRVGGPDVAEARLAELEGGKVCIVNAAGMRDLEVLVEALLRVEAQGKRFIYRTAASFVRARLGQSARPLLTGSEIIGQGNDSGGLVIVGSYVQRSTGQLQHLLANTDIHPEEVHVSELLSDETRGAEVARVSQNADRKLAAGQNVVIFTSRELVSGSTPEENLSIIQTVSQGLVAVAQNISHRPRFLIAKGGNTSSDLATKGLKVRRCVVPGQILPGVPVWELGGESRFPGLNFVVFPGNVGGEDALTLAVNKLTSHA